MGEETRGRRKRIAEDIEKLVNDVASAAGSVGETLRDTIKETVEGARSARDSVVMVRVNKESLSRLEDLIEAGMASSRSEAAAYLITEGIKSRQGLFDRIAEKIEQIRRSRDELRTLLEDEDARPASPE